MGNVNVRLNFIENNKSLDKIKKDLLNIKKTAEKELKIKVNNTGIKEASKIQALKVQQLKIEGMLLDANNKKMSSSKLILNEALKQIRSGVALKKEELQYIQNIIKQENWAFKNKKQAYQFEQANLKKIKAEEKAILGLKIKQAQATNKSITSQTGIPTKSAKSSADVFKEQFKAHEAGIVKLNPQYEKYNKLTSTAIKNTTKVNKVVSSTGKATSSTTRELYGMASAMMLLNRTINIYRKSVTELASLDKTFYNLGVVGRLTTTQIEDLKIEMLEFASDMPTSAKEIAESINTIARTGRSLEEATKIVRDGIQLAVGSGEDLGTAVSIVNKVMVGFKLNANQAKDAMESFHSATLATPLDLHKLNESMKNATGAFGVFADTTTKSGEQLTQYKQELLDTAVAVSGGLSLMGRSASSNGERRLKCRCKIPLIAGTSYKVLNTNLRQKCA